MVGTKEDLDVWGSFLCSTQNISSDATKCQPSMLVPPGFGTKTPAEVTDRISSRPNSGI